MLRYAAVFATLLVLGACGAPQTATDSVVRRPAPPKLSFTAEGPLAMRRGADYTEAALAPHFPGLKVAPTTDGDPAARFDASADGLILFEILPDAKGRRVAWVETRSPAVAGPRDEIIGVTRYAEAPQAEVAFCKMEPRIGDRRFSCAASEAASFWRIFHIAPLYAAPVKAFPEIPPGAVEQSTLSGFRWFPPVEDVAQ